MRGIFLNQNIYRFGWNFSRKKILRLKFYDPSVSPPYIWGDKANNELKDKSNEYIVSTSYKPTSWFNIDLSYNYNTGNEKYHFLMTREKPHFGETPRIFNNEYYIVDDDSREYLFTSSLNKQKSVTLNSSTYIKNINVTTNI